MGARAYLTHHIPVPCQVPVNPLILQTLAQTSCWVRGRAGGSNRGKRNLNLEEHTHQETALLTTEVAAPRVHRTCSEN